MDESVEGTQVLTQFPQRLLVVDDHLAQAGKGRFSALMGKFIRNVEEAKDNSAVVDAREEKH